MDIKTFLDNYREAFGAKAPLPVLFYYSDEAVAPPERIGGCLFKGLARVREGQPLTLTGDAIGCGGGKLYTAFAPMPAFVPTFVSEKERYKQTPQDVLECIEKLDIRPATGPYLNFVRLDRAAGFDPMEGLLFFATPDMLSGLTTWAYFDNNADDAVAALFGSGCAAVISVAVRENRLGGDRTFVGLFDPSVRPYIGANELSFVIPAGRFRTMYETMRRTCLFDTHAWAKVKERIGATPECREKG